MSLRKLAGLLAAFGLTVGLIGGGVGAVFHDQVTAQENIDVGTFSCGITTATTGATFGAIDALGYAHSVSYTAPTIESSDPGSAPFSFTVKNTGSIPDVLTVSTSPVGSPFSIIGAPFGPVPLASGASNVYDTGVAWTTLDNSNLGQHGTVTWTVDCGEANHVGAAYYTTSSSAFCRSAAPQTGSISGGTFSQVVNPDGSLTLSITGATSYADIGFYVPFGTLGAITSYSITSSGDPIGTNLYLDTSGNGDFFAWAADCMTGLDGDTYAGGGGTAGTYTVNGTTPFYVLGGLHAGDTYTLTTLQSGSVSGITSSTQVAVWVGLTLGSGGTASVTITSAP